jgi:small subunit ribosomal protein S7
MSRRRRAVKRKVEPDALYNSVALAKFINKVMIGGKKSTAKTIVYGALEGLKKKLNVDNALEAFEQALENAKPTLEVKSRRIGGATYQVPIEIAPDRRAALAVRWILMYAKSKVGKSMKDGLTQELADCYNNQGSTIKKRDDTHRMAEANKAFAHYKW